MALPPISSRRALVLSALVLAVPVLIALGRGIPDETSTAAAKAAPIAASAIPSAPASASASVAHVPTAATPIAPAPLARSSRAPRMSPAAPVPSVPGEAGMRVARDPETGELGPPTPEQSAALGHPAEALGGNYADLPVTILPNGAWKVTLDERFMDYAVVRRAPDGSLHMDCVRDGARGGSAVAAPAPAALAAPAAPVWEVR